GGTGRAHRRCRPEGGKKQQKGSLPHRAKIPQISEIWTINACPCDETDPFVIRPRNFLFPESRMSPSRPVRKAVFPVAGMGTRFLPATKAVPKEMLPVVDKPVVQYAVEEAKEAGIEQFIFVTGRGKHIIEDHFDHAYELESLLEARDKTKELNSLLESLPPTGSVGFIRQQQPLGLGHAVWCARHFVGNEPFAVLLPDDLMVGTPGALSQMISAYDRVGGGIIVAAEEKTREETK